jgi:hypothetical protein
MRTVTFALFAGVIYLAVGLLGLIPAALMPPPADAPPVHFNLLHGYLFGLFPVNILHSAVHLAIGFWGIVTWHGLLANPKLYPRTLAVIYGVLTVMGFIPQLNTLFGLLPIHGHDVWLHGATAAIAAYFGWRTEVVVERRAGPEPDRRTQPMLVANERRAGHSDRRLPFSEV